MASDDDIARLLPEPPPPRPARREASIAEALRRFDGVEEPPPIAAPRPSRWRGLGRPQIGVLVSAALIALIGAPAAWISLHDRFPATGVPASNVTESVAVADAPASVPNPSPAASGTPASPSAAALRSAATPGNAPAGLADKAAAAPVANAVPAAPPPPAPAMKMAQPSAAAPPPPPPPPPAVASRAAPALEAQPDATADIAVTASRMRAPARSGRAEGLARLSDEDIDDAIAASDRALARDPHDATAWLNRGLARQRKGDLNGALDDLNHAIRLAPEAPAGYRARARLERQRGDGSRAAADERRAAELDADR
jgi:tetratricopeptide (TPR) repeat protein